MTVQRQELGRHAEDLAAAHLTDHGWQIVARNARTRHGEIDIIATRARQLAFVEVKAGRAGSDLGPEKPAHSVGPRKQIKLRRLAAAWLAANGAPPACAEFRFDVIGVSFGPGRQVSELDHIEGAFWW